MKPIRTSRVERWGDGEKAILGLISSNHRKPLLKPVISGLFSHMKEKVVLCILSLFPLVTATNRTLK